MVIGRQTSAAVDDGTVFPDLLALDKDGNLVIIELKKSRAPREVTGQILEYAAWANDLSQEALIDIAANYLRASPDRALHEVTERFTELFGAESFPALKNHMRLFIAAESIPPSVSRVCRFLRTKYEVDVSCIAFSVFKTSSGEIIVSTEVVVGHEETNLIRIAASRWSGDKPVRQIVREAVSELTKNDNNRIFSPREVAEIIIQTYPTFNRSTVGCQIVSDCVNHSSRKYYPGGDDRYWWIEKGKYRLHNSNSD